MFSILTKVGVYAVLRLWLLLFGGAAGAELLLYGGMATIAYGVSGMLAAQTLGRLAGFNLIVSSGTLLAAIGAGQAAATGAALYYLLVSTLGSAAFFLLIELVERARTPGADVLAVTAAAFGVGDEERRAGRRNRRRDPRNHGAARPELRLLRAAGGRPAAASRVPREVRAARGAPCP